VENLFKESIGVTEKNYIDVIAIVSLPKEVHIVLAINVEKAAVSYFYAQRAYFSMIHSTRQNYNYTSAPYYELQIV
jgi:hypothetical protein